MTLILENHYKDDFWEYPEFAQKMDLFCALVDAIDDPPAVIDQFEFGIDQVGVFGRPDQAPPPPHRRPRR